MAITSTFLSNVTASIFTSEGSNAVTAAYFCNTGERIAYLTVHAVPKNQVASNVNIIYYQVPINVQDTYILDTEKIILEDGDGLFATISYNYFASNTRVIATVSTIGI